jgi:hypothetical protein
MLAKVVQQDSWTNNNNTASPWTQDFVFADGNPGEQDVTEGNAILVFWSGTSANTLSSITDNYGNTYSKIAGASKTDSNVGWDGEWWIATNVAAVTYPVGPRLALTFTYAGSPSGSFWALEISGVNSATQVTGTEEIDITNGSNFSGPSLNGGSVGAIYLTGLSGTFENETTVSSPWSIESALLEDGVPSVATLVSTGTQHATFTPEPSPGWFIGVVCGLAFTGVSIYETPAPTSCSPTSGAQGATISNFTVNGSGFGTAGTLAFSGTGITVNSYSTQTDTEIVASITIAANAAAAASNVTVTNATGGLTGTLSGAFTVNAQPAPTSVTPTTGAQGATISNFTVRGSGFGTGGTLSFSGTGITVNSYSVQTDSQIVASITISALALATIRDVTVTNTTDSLTGTLPECFTVTAAVGAFEMVPPTFPTAPKGKIFPKASFAGKMLVFRPGYGKRR